MAPLVGQLKKQYGLSERDFKKLREIKSDKKLDKFLTKKIGNSKLLQTKDWNVQGDIDCKNLKDRINHCSNIWSDVKDIFQESLVDGKIVEPKDFMFAGVKA